MVISSNPNVVNIVNTVVCDQKLTLIKKVNNDEFGGTSVVSDWILSGDGPGDAEISGATDNASVTDASVVTGEWALSESGPEGYAASEWTCTKGNGEEAIVTTGSVTIGQAEAITCTITNTALPGSLSWAKVNNSPTTASLAGSEWSLTGPGENAATVPITDCVADTLEECATGPDLDNRAGHFQLAGLDWGEYTLTETKAPPGFKIGGTIPAFTISGTKLDVALSDIVNIQQDGPKLPLTGGLGKDQVYIAGAFVLLTSMAAYGSMRLQRRRGQRTAS